MSQELDPYIVLEIERNECDLGIKSAYRRLAKQWHPDKNSGNSDAEAKFKAISEAYDILKDPQKRAAYDRFGHRAFDATINNKKSASQRSSNDVFLAVYNLFPDNIYEKDDPDLGFDRPDTLETRYMRAIHDGLTALRRDAAERLLRGVKSSPSSLLGPLLTSQQIEACLDLWDRRYASFLEELIAQTPRMRRQLGSIAPFFDTYALERSGALNKDIAVKGSRILDRRVASLKVRTERITRALSEEGLKKIDRLLELERLEKWRGLIREATFVLDDASKIMDANVQVEPLRGSPLHTSTRAARTLKL